MINLVRSNFSGVLGRWESMSGGIGVSAVLEKL